MHRLLQRQPVAEHVKREAGGIVAGLLFAPDVAVQVERLVRNALQEDLDRAEQGEALAQWLGLSELSVEAYEKHHEVVKKEWQEEADELKWNALDRLRDKVQEALKKKGIYVEIELDGNAFHRLNNLEIDNDNDQLRAAWGEAENWEAKHDEAAEAYARLKKHADALELEVERLRARGAA